MKNLHIAIIGATGRLGSSIKKNYKKTYCITSNTNQEDIPYKEIDVFVDVSQPNIILNYIDPILEHKKPLIIGSTGHSKETLSALNNSINIIPLLIAENFSKGIFLVKRMLEQLQIAPSLITETHHKNKLDKPSGTAKLLASVFDHPPPISSIRKKDAIGTHTLSYKLNREQIEITHKSHSLELFSDGASKAISFLYEKEKGLYTMDDVYEKELYESKSTSTNKN